VTANHGGVSELWRETSADIHSTPDVHPLQGYQYRMCPAHRTLDEECFQETPLDFTGLQGFRWGSVSNGSSIFFNGTYATGDMVVPKVGDQ
jgi:hypothetical protein